MRMWSVGDDEHHRRGGDVGIYAAGRNGRPNQRFWAEWNDGYGCYMMGPQNANHYYIRSFAAGNQVELDAYGSSGTCWH